MKRKLTIRIFTSLFVIGLAVWLGGSLIRLAVAYDIYVPATELAMKTHYTDQLRLHTVRLFGMGALYTDIAYGCAFFAAIMLVILMKGKMKIKGWPVISFTLFLLTVPLEALMIYFDIKLNLAIHNELLTTFNSDIVKDYFISRFTKYNFVSPSAYLCGASSLIFSILRPLDREKSDS